VKEKEGGYQWNSRGEKKKKLFREGRDRKPYK
jgi:hypothetical protein